MSQNTFSSITTRLREFIARACQPPRSGACFDFESEFNQLALCLFDLQYAHNPAYRQFCDYQAVRPEMISHWSKIPAMPAAAFKDFEVSCLPANERGMVFLSSGTTSENSSRHVHNSESIGLYEFSALSWFEANFFETTPADRPKWQMIFLTPDRLAAPHSSLAYMFAIFQQSLGKPDSAFLGRTDSSDAWLLEFERLDSILCQCAPKPVALFGTAFNFVHLLDYLEQRNAIVQLPEGSWILETGGYKGRSRVLKKTELHDLLSARLGVPPRRIVSEYGMCELSSQAYDASFLNRSPDFAQRFFQFPPWVRYQVISSETGREVPIGETGLLRIFDLANVYSLMAIQTEDLAVCHGQGFELIGRAAAPARGCSLMSVA